MSSRRAVIVAALALAGLVPRMLAAESGQLQLLMDKAAKREALFDGVEAQYSFSASFGGGMRQFQPQRPGGEGRSERPAAETQRPTGERSYERPPAEAPRPQGERRYERPPDREPERPRVTGGESFNMETSVHWAKSGNNVLVESTIKGQTPLGDRGIESFRSATDGQTARALLETGGGYRGFVTAEGSGPARLMGVTPDNFVTGLPFSSASTLDLLTAKTDEMTFRMRGRDPVTITVERQTRLIGEETIDGHTCLVVEVTETRSPRGFPMVERLYFGQDVNYAVVRVEQGLLRGEEFVSRGIWTMGDFREVKPGLFVPFLAVSQRRTREGDTLEMARFALDGVSFPGVFADGFFDIVFPTGTIMRDNVAEISYMMGRPEGEIDFLSPVDAEADFPEEPAVEAASEVSPAAPEPAPPAATAPSRWTGPVPIALAIAAVVAAAAIVAFLRRKRS